MFPWYISLSIIFLAVQPSVCQSSSNVVPESAVCTTRECQEISDEIIAAMNDEINPCDNFYEFACGHWASSNPKPSFLGNKWNNMALLHFLTRSRLGGELRNAPSSSDIEPIKKMKEYYKLCMNTNCKKSKKRHVDQVLDDMIDIVNAGLHCVSFI